jgi:DNA mismatch repair protein MutH
MFGSGSGSGSGGIQWPELDELKQVLDVTSDDWDGDLDDTRLTRLLAAAIDKVKQDVGDWDELTDQPDANLAQAALRMGEMMALRPEAAAQAASDPTYQRLIYGHRRRFGIA